MIARPWTATVTLLAVALAAGCSRSGPHLAPVRGRVLYHDVPVAGATVEFVPDATAGTHGPSSFGGTAADGSFTLDCPPHGAGAVVGSHRVRVLLYPGSEALPPRYAHPATSKLEVTVPEGGLSDLVLTLED